jgi:hypothetical protein
LNFAILRGGQHPIQRVHLTRRVLLEILEVFREGAELVEEPRVRIGSAADLESTDFHGDLVGLHQRVGKADEEGVLLGVEFLWIHGSTLSLQS